MIYKSRIYGFIYNFEQHVLQQKLREAPSFCAHANFAVEADVTGTYEFPTFQVYPPLSTASSASSLHIV